MSDSPQNDLFRDLKMFYLQKQQKPHTRDLFSSSETITQYYYHADNPDDDDEKCNVIAVNIEESKLPSFIATIKIIQTLNHPHIANYLGLKRDEHHPNRFGVVYESFKTTLAHELCKELDDSRKTRYIKEIFSAISYLHTNNIIHRHLKPHQIGIFNDKVKLFGFLDCCHGPTSSEHKERGVYAAPEIEKGTYSYSVDIYSFGIIMYQIIKNTPTFDHYELNGKLHFESFSGTFSWAPSLIKSMIDKNPSKRPSIEKIQGKLDKIHHFTESKECHSEHEFKVVMIGATGVGKTTIVKNAIVNENGTQRIGIEATIGTANVQKTIVITEEKPGHSNQVRIHTRTVRLNISDTAGQEQYQSLIPSYVRGIDCAIFVFAANDPGSFQQWKNYHKLVTDQNSKDVTFWLVRNKCDLEHRVTEDDMNGVIDTAKNDGNLYKSTNTQYNHPTAYESLFCDIARHLVDQKHEQAIPMLEPTAIGEIESDRKCC